MDWFSEKKISYWQREIKDIEFSIELAKKGGILWSFEKIADFHPFISNEKWIKILEQRKTSYLNLIEKENKRLSGLELNE